MDDVISRQTETEDRQVSLKQVLDTVDEMPVMKDNNGMEFIEKSLAKTRVRMLPSVQPELIEKAAYIRGFEQGRTQGMIDAQGGKK